MVFGFLLLPRDSPLFKFLGIRDISFSHWALRIRALPSPVAVEEMPILIIEHATPDCRIPGQGVNTIPGSYKCCGERLESGQSLMKTFRFRNRPERGQLGVGGGFGE